MKAVRFYAPGDIRFEDVDVPKPGPGEILLRVKTALTCGTDLKTYRRGHPVMIQRAPTVFGHELAGVVAALGEEVSTLAVGERVVAANSAPCNRCLFCQMERHSLCENIEFFNGAYAEYAVIPRRIVEQNVLRIPERVSFRQAALVEPLACAIHGIEESSIRLGDTVCVIGAGPIGLMLMRLSKLKGARVIAVDKVAGRLEKARQMGADELIDASTVSDAVSAVKALTPGGYGVDVSIEAAGVPALWEMAIAIARKGALVNLFGGCESGSSIKVGTERLHYGELKIIGVFHHTPYYVRRALSLIADGSIDANALITHEMELARLADALELVASGEALKVAIIP
jgi:L-iditol 2-dehydrogenase